MQHVYMHDHVCAIYDDRREGLFSIVAFIASGLGENERCLYVTNDATTEAALGALQNGGLEAKNTIMDGRLKLYTKPEAHLEGYQFDPGRAVQFLIEAADESEEEGFRGMRSVIEMTSKVGEDPEIEGLLEYENKLNSSLYPNHAAAGLCQFDLRRFPPSAVQNILYTHPKVLIGGIFCRNFYYKPPEEYAITKHEEKAEQEVVRMIENLYQLSQTETQLKQEQDILKRRVTELENDKKIVEAQLEQLRPSQLLAQENAELISNELMARYRNDNKRILLEQNLPAQLHNDLPVELECECDTPDCGSTITLLANMVKEIRRSKKRFIITPGHENPRIETVVAENGVYVLVEKNGN